MNLRNTTSPEIKPNGYGFTIKLDAANTKPYTMAQHVYRNQNIEFIITDSSLEPLPEKLAQGEYGGSKNTAVLDLKGCLFDNCKITFFQDEPGLVSVRTDGRTRFKRCGFAGCEDVEFPVGCVINDNKSDMHRGRLSEWLSPGSDSESIKSDNSVLVYGHSDYTGVDMHVSDFYPHVSDNSMREPIYPWTEMFETPGEIAHAYVDRLDKFYKELLECETEGDFQKSIQRMGADVWEMSAGISPDLEDRQVEIDKAIGELLDAKLNSHIHTNPNHFSKPKESTWDFINSWANYSFTPDEMSSNRMSKIENLDPTVLFSSLRNKELFDNFIVPAAEMHQIYTTQNEAMLDAVVKQVIENGVGEIKDAGLSAQVHKNIYDELKSDAYNICDTFRDAKRNGKKDISFSQQVCKRLDLTIDQFIDSVTLREIKRTNEDEENNDKRREEEMLDKWDEQSKTGNYGEYGEE